ncbi:MAG: hypothetical protein K8I29_16185 [Alphaproteobacteria bacterium]|uniref:Uncharacterized protein n=1 Tax=Candidatus Nitrobium versatile TaxID=2884831 RepID=A0A953SCQ9_9BACT|nr:hypothetical protein [Candidatus Nitrobium versatile]
MKMLTTITGKEEISRTADNVLVLFGRFNFSNQGITRRCQEYDLECIVKEVQQ